MTQENNRCALPSILPYRNVIPFVRHEVEPKPCSSSDGVERHAPICAALLYGGGDSVMGSGLVQVPVRLSSVKEVINEYPRSAAGIAIDHSPLRTAQSDGHFVKRFDVD
jgi:hypothetical protein